MTNIKDFYLAESVDSVPNDKHYYEFNYLWIWIANLKF